MTTCVGPAHVINAVQLPAFPDEPLGNNGTENVPERTLEVTSGSEVEADTGSGETAAPEHPAVADEGNGGGSGQVCVRLRLVQPLQQCMLSWSRPAHTNQMRIFALRVHGLSGTGVPMHID